jgi:hypothetical protein
VDEMDTINSFSLETQAQLRRIFQRFTNHNLSIVVAGVRLQQHWAGETSPFYNMFIPVPLDSFPEIEARRLITEPSKDVYSYSEEAVLRILKATLGKPHRIQQLCLETIHYLRATSRERTKIMAEDVDIVLQTIQWLGEEITEPGIVANSSTNPQLPITTEKEVMQERISALQRQLIARMRHLDELELQQAKMGFNTPPHIITEIEDYQEAIANIEAELAKLGENITPSL